MIRTIYQTNRRVRARTLVTKDRVLALLCSRQLLLIMTILTLEKVVLNRETTCNCIAGSIVYVLHESGVMWKMSELFLMRKNMCGQRKVLSYSFTNVIEVTGPLWKGNGITLTVNLFACCWITLFDPPCHVINFTPGKALPDSPWNSIRNMRHKFLTAVTMDSGNVWDVTQRNPVGVSESTIASFSRVEY
jgi:hypothetical protein